MISAIFAAAMLMAQSTPAAASEPTPSTPAVAPAAPGADVNVAKGPKVNKDGLICHSEPVLGSRIPKKVCMTPAQAEDRAQQDRLMLDHMQGSQGGINSK
jgi:hypothetical protein